MANPGLSKQQMQDAVNAYAKAGTKVEAAKL